MGSSGIGVCVRFRRSPQLKASHKALQHAASSSEKALSSERLAFRPFWGCLGGWFRSSRCRCSLGLGFRAPLKALLQLQSTRLGRLLKSGVCMSSLQIARSVELRASQ